MHTSSTTARRTSQAQFDAAARPTHIFAVAPRVSGRALVEALVVARRVVRQPRVDHLACSMHVRAVMPGRVTRVQVDMAWGIAYKTEAARAVRL